MIIKELPGDHELRELGKDTIRMLKSWNVNDLEAAQLLRADNDTYNYIIESQSFPRSTDVTDSTSMTMRARYLLRMWRALQSIYHRNRDLANKWMRKSSSRYGGKSALEYILASRAEIDSFTEVVDYLETQASRRTSMP